MHLEPQRQKLKQGLGLPCSYLPSIFWVKRKNLKLFMTGDSKRSLKLHYWTHVAQLFTTIHNRRDWKNILMIEEMWNSGIRFHTWLLNSCTLWLSFPEDQDTLILAAVASLAQVQWLPRCNLSCKRHSNEETERKLEKIWAAVQDVASCACYKLQVYRYV